MTTTFSEPNGDMFVANQVRQEMLLRAVSIQQQQPLVFQKTLEDEVRRVARFLSDQQVDRELAAKALFCRADALATSSTGSIQEGTQVQLQNLQQSAVKMVDDCLALQEFLTTSRRILLETATMAEEQQQQPGQQHYARMVYQHLPKAHLNSSLVCILSDTFHAQRQLEEAIRKGGADNGTELWQAPSSFQRTTTKYWVKDEHLTKLMMICAMEAPLLVYGKKGPLTSTKRSTINKSEGDKLWDELATVITSVYFDAPDMSLYKERLKRAEGAQLLRARWYGIKVPTGDQTIFVELKTHHEKWVANKSVKERAAVLAKDMESFLEPVPWKKEDATQMILRAKPNVKGEELAKATGLLLRMHALVVQHKLTACVRSVYDRAAFQSAKSNDLRLTLDRNVTVVNERDPQCLSISGDWCLTDAQAQMARASVVPFNVFEVKLASDDPMPTGLAQAQDDSTMVLAPKFSKFLTGAAAFNAVPVLPYWAAHPSFYSFFELDKRAASTSPSSSSESDDYNLMGSSSNEMASGTMKIPKGIVIAPKNPARIEPKTFFANERTFVQWISASILLLSISGFLLNAGNSGAYNTTAAVISFFSMGLVVYSTALYFRRLNLLKVREPYGYFNRVTPIFLAVVVGLAIFLIWADSIKGKDFLSFSRMVGKDRRFLRPLVPRRILQQEYEKCPQEEVIGTKLLIKENPSSLMVDFERHSFLMTSGEFVYIQPMVNDDGSVPSKADSLIRIDRSHLQGLAIVGHQLFAVSDGPERTELIEMAWWGTRNGNERLRVVGRWALEESKSQIDGFSFVPSTISASMGSLYINMNSSIRAYSVPARSENDEPDQSDHPMRLKTLNMKVLTQGMTVGGKGNNDHLSTMITFEGITYILRSKKNVLEAWNLTDGTLFSEIELPATEGDNAMMMWTGFAFEKRMATSTTTPNVRGGDMLETVSSEALFLHLMTDETTFGGQIWTFPVLKDSKMPSGPLSVPSCQISMN